MKAHWDHYLAILVAVGMAGACSPLKVVDGPCSEKILVTDTSGFVGVGTASVDVSVAFTSGPTYSFHCLPSDAYHCAKVGSAGPFEATWSGPVSSSWLDISVEGPLMEASLTVKRVGVTGVSASRTLAIPKSACWDDVRITL